MAGNNLGTARGSIQVDTSGLKNADIALRSAGDSMVGFGLQAVGAFAAIVGEAAKFEKEMDFVQAVTASSAEEMRLLEEKALDLAKNSIFGPIELSQAFVELAKAGASAEEIIAGVGEASVQLATAADVEIPFAGENLINILNTFSLGAEDAVRVADMLAGAANASSVELSDIVTTMRYAGPVAAAMGISIEEVNEALSVLGRVGIKGSTAGTSLRFMMTRLVPDTDKAKEAIAGLGLNIDEATGAVTEFTNTDGSLKNLGDIMQILQDRTKGLTDQQKIAVVNDIFGVRAMPSVLALMEAGKDGFLEMGDAIERTTAADVAAKRMDNLDGSIKRLKATLSAMFVEAGGPFQQMLKGWVDGLRDFLLFIDALPGPLKTFLVGAIGVIGIMSLFAGAFLLTIGNIVRMVRVIAEIRNAFALFSGAARAASGANAVLSASFLLNPWVLLALAIAAVVAALVILYFKWDDFREFVNGIAGDVVDAWNAVADWFKGPFVDAVSGAWDAVHEFFDDTQHAWDGFVSAFGGNGVTTSLHDITGVAERIGVAFRAAFDWAKDFLGLAWDSIAGFFTSIGDAIGGAASSAFDAFIGFFSDLPGLIGRGLSKALGAFVRFLGKLPGLAGYWLGFVHGRILRIVFYEIPKIFINMARSVINALTSFGGDAFNWAVGFGSGFVATIASWIQQLPGLIVQFFTEILNFLIGLVPMLYSLGFDLGGNLFNSLWDWLSRIPGMIQGFMGEAVQFILNAGPQALAAAVSFGQSVWDGITQLILNLPQTVMDIVDRCIRAFTDMVRTAYNAAKDFAGGLWNGFKDGLGINSPSLIEQQLMAISESADVTQRNLMRSIRGMNGSVSGLNGMNLSQNSAPATRSTTNQWNQNAPLIGQATIRDERDIHELARELDNLHSEKMAAVGRRIVR